jgi:hypothetical protein
MDPFSYICILTSIVAGLAVTRLVSGFGQLLQTRARTPPYWVHALWMVNVLLTIIITWWVQYRWRNVPHWTLFLFLWLLVAPLILYLVAALPTKMMSSSPVGANIITQTTKRSSRCSG